MFRTAQAHRLLRQTIPLGELNAWVVPCAYRDIPASRRKAIGAETERSRGTVRNAGRSVAVKDNICTARESTTCASASLLGFRSPFAATVVDLLETDDEFIAGKTNLDEFGMGFFPNFLTSGSSD